MSRSLFDAVRTSLPVWQARNLPHRIRYGLTRRPLSPAVAAVARDLASGGIAVTRLSDLFPGELVSELDRYVLRQWERLGIDRQIGELRARPTASQEKTSYLLDLWEGEHRLDLSNPFVRFSLSVPVLSIVSSYLGMLPKFREFFLQVTAPVASGDPYASQRWHADPDDRRMVKVFLYLNGVDETAGPFSYIRCSHGGGRWRHLFPFAPKARSRRPDPAFIQAHVPAEDIVVATGPAGTLIFCDTSGVHRGGYATRGHRTMWTGVYTTPASALPKRISVPASLPSNLSAAARFAIANETW